MLNLRHADIYDRIEKNSNNLIPILGIYRSEFDLNDERAKSMGFNGYMLKPLEIDVLENKLVEIMHASKT